MYRSVSGILRRKWDAIVTNVYTYKDMYFIIGGPLSCTLILIDTGLTQLGLWPHYQLSSYDYTNLVIRSSTAVQCIGFKAYTPDNRSTLIVGAAGPANFYCKPFIYIYDSACVWIKVNHSRGTKPY